MTTLLRFDSSKKTNPSFAVPITPGTMYRVSLQIWSFADDLADRQKKAALLVFRFLDVSGREIIHPRLPRSGPGFSYRYLSFDIGETIPVDFQAPDRAVRVELFIRPWHLKAFTAEIIKFGEKERADTRSRPAGSLLWQPAGSINKTFRQLTGDQIQLRLFFEAMVMEERREKTDYSLQATKLPPADEMNTAAPYELARDYLAMRRQLRTGGPRHLVISSGYPDSENLYVNGFLHARIRQYQAAGVDVDVVAFARGMKPEIWRYDGVDVIAGYVNQLAPVLALEDYQSVSVHFLNSHMWNVMKVFSDRHRFHLVIHGHEIRNWIRSFDPASGYETARQGTSRSETLRDFWHHVTTSGTMPNSFLFVSEWLKDMAEEDIMRSFPQDRCHVIHNFINADHFPYVEKPAAHARKILIIRNFDKYVYATDIALNCLKALRKRPIWNTLEVSIYGQGAGLAEFERTFAADENVTIAPGYLTAQQMQEAYANHGIMLIPSRLDSQGVSRGEAMAAGLVPATNRVCAIPEFVNDTCAIMTESEDFLAMADEIEKLAGNPKRFKAMSRAAAERIRQQCSYEQTIEKELRLFGLK